MALISGGILVLMRILGHDFSSHYNRLTLISVDIISGVYCRIKEQSLRSPYLAAGSWRNFPLLFKHGFGPSHFREEEKEAVHPVTLAA